MENENIKIVEINGIKVEVDLRNAKVISNYKVGDKVKVLIKEYSDTYKTYPGVIVGFDDFEKLPTIIIMYVDSPAYSSEVKIKTIFMNSNTKDTEITIANDFDMSLDREEVIENFNKEILKYEIAIKEVNYRKNIFLIQFSKYFKDLA